MGINKRRNGILAAAGLVTTALLATSAGMAAGAGDAASVAPTRSKDASATVVSPAGATLGTVRFIPVDGRSKMIVRARLEGVTAGFHGFHVHTAGVCDPNAVDAAGNPSPFFTAGGHYNPGGSIHGAHAGDMPPLLVTEDGTGFLKFATDRVKMKELLDADGAAVILHAGPDNLAHVPAASAAGGERYHSHVDNVFGPDTLTKATGDAGARAGCGVIGRS